MITERWSRHALRTLDRLAVDEFGIPSVLLMENAARGTTDVAETMIADRQLNDVLIVAGVGNNGGDGYAVARQLDARGHRVRISQPLGGARTSDAITNQAICQTMHLPISQDVRATSQTLLIDGLFGTGLTRAVEGEAKGVVEQINASPATVLAIDIPSGVDADTGAPLGVAVESDATASFVGLKLGMPASGEGSPFGKIHIVDIGVPRSLKQRLGSA